jgi:hypothetical protein
VFVLVDTNDTVGVGLGVAVEVLVGRGVRVEVGLGVGVRVLVGVGVGVWIQRIILSGAIQLRRKTAASNNAGVNKPMPAGLYSNLRMVIGINYFCQNNK